MLISQMLLWGINKEARKLVQEAITSSAPSCYYSAICSISTAITLLPLLVPSITRLFAAISTEYYSAICSAAVGSARLWPQCVALTGRDVFFINLADASFAKSTSWSLKRTPHTAALRSITIDKRQKTESYIVERRWRINAQETNVRMGSTLQVLVSQKHFCKLVWPTFNFVNWIILVEALQKLCSGPAAKKSAWKRCQNIWPTHHSGFQLHATGIQHWHLVPLHWHGWPRAEEMQLLWLEPTFH